MILVFINGLLQSEGANKDYTNEWAGEVKFVNPLQKDSEITIVEVNGAKTNTIITESGEDTVRF